MILFWGKIEKGDDLKFKKLVADNNIRDGAATVSLNSNGGHALAGFGIGRTIAENKFWTFVDGKSVCASACADVWLAGAERWVEAGARIGFHSTGITLKQGRREWTVPSNAGNALTGAYYKELRLSDKAIMMLVTAPPNQMLWLTTKIANDLQIDFSFWQPQTRASARKEDAR